MKTISYRTAGRGLIPTFLLLGGLVGLYVFRKRGGQIMPLLEKGREYLRSTAIDGEPTRKSVVDSVIERAREIPTSIEDLDRMPAQN